MSEAVGQPKCCVFCTNNPSDSSLYFVRLVDNFHPSEIVDESGLMVLPAGRTFACWVDMTVEKRTEA